MNSNVTGDRSPIGFGLFTLREEAKADLPAVVAELASIGYRGVEPVCFAGATGEYLKFATDKELDRVDPIEFRLLLEDHGMSVCSAHVPMLERGNASELLDEQDLLGNKLLVVPTPRLVEGFETRPYDVDMVKDLAERFNVASELAAERQMRVGYHNHGEEFEVLSGGEIGFDLFFGSTEPSVFSELDVTWIASLGVDVPAVIDKLGDRAVLVHSRGQIGATLGDSSSVVCRIVDLGTIQSSADRWSIVRSAYDQLTGVAA